MAGQQTEKTCLVVELKLMMEQMYALTLIELINDELNKSFLR